VREKKEDKNKENKFQNQNKSEQKLNAEP